MFGQNLVSCNDFVGCHDEVTVADVDFIDGRPICDHVSARKECSSALPTRTIISYHQFMLMVAERKS